MVTKGVHTSGHIVFNSCWCLVLLCIHLRFELGTSRFKLSTGNVEVPCVCDWLEWLLLLRLVELELWLGLIVLLLVLLWLEAVERVMGAL